ncbi:MAG: oxygen-independent coproporphyrinogen III oxidase [Chlorobi bacterium]|nr:oxygen-independent coproporphyrinogen III oxidase [Chlorobiota bacterium]
MNIDKKLLDKYNVPTPRYTSYPPANFFTSDFKPQDAVNAIKKSNNLKPENISFYLHIPFCSRLCYYCGCNTHITGNRNIINNYVDTLKKEILIYKKLLSPRRKISQIHWGGGTPDYLDINQIKDIMNIFYDNFDFIENAEKAMECHPAHLTYEYKDALAQLGFNRLSIGIQDFNETVLKNVNRALPALPVEDSVKYLHKKGISVNLDFVYGLPGQTIESFSETIRKAVNINPDRLALFSYAHVPWVKPHQKLLEKYNLPDAELKTSLFQTAFNILTESNYVSIGLDHFAKTDDELYTALKNRELGRNFQGYCTRETTGQVYALGVSGISQLENAFLQNTKNLKQYSDSINNEILPFEKAYFLNENEKITGHIIAEIMSNRYISLADTEKKFNISYDDIIKITGLDFDVLKTFEKEKLIEINGKEISVTHQGMFFLRNIAAAFDPLTEQSEKKFSKSL